MKNMKKKAVLLIAAVLCMGTLTGCGIVKVVPIGEEAAYSGKEVFDSAAQSGSDWAQVVEDITGAAADLADILDGEGTGKGMAVSGKAEIVEFNTDTPKYYLRVIPDNYSGSVEVRIQAGGVYSGTAVRDVQTIKEFKDFTNQTEWSQYGKALNKEVDSQVVAPLGLDESVKGKTVTFVGAAVESGGMVTVTPVSMSIE